MMVRNGLAFALAVMATPTPSWSQTTRERAVAIDFVPVQASDSFSVERIGPVLASPWSIAFLPDGRFLVTEKHGGLRVIGRDGVISPPLPGMPTSVLQLSDSGLLDVVLDPDFASNHNIYMAFVEGSEDANRTAIWKARFDGDRLSGGRVIFRVAEPKKGASHPGGRMLLLPDGTLLLTVGDGFDFKEKAQDPTSQLGKVLRLTGEGKTPSDNPFIGQPGHAPEIWTMGHRNIQGLTLDPATGTIWSHEHGPRGGDEINILTAGRNYGWPTVSHGIDYDGSIITSIAHRPDFADSSFVWAPSIAPSGLAIYHGARFPQWDGKLLVGALAARTLVLLRRGRDTGLLVEEGRLLTGLRERIRDVRVAPDGEIYLLTDGENGRLMRLVPASAAQLESALTALGALVGRWQGESRYLTPFGADASPLFEHSSIECQPALKATVLRCHADLYRTGDGRLRVVELDYSKDPAKQGFSALVRTGGWPGLSQYETRWDPTEQAWVGLSPTEHEGKPAMERIVDRVSPDGKSVLHSEAIRLNSAPAADWTETFRWTWSKIE